MRALNEQSALQRLTSVSAYAGMFFVGGLAFFPWPKAIAFGYVCGLFAGLLNAIYQEVRR